MGEKCRLDSVHNRAQGLCRGLGQCQGWQNAFRIITKCRTMPWFIRLPGEPPVSKKNRTRCVHIKNSILLVCSLFFHDPGNPQRSINRPLGFTPRLFSCLCATVTKPFYGKSHGTFSDSGLFFFLSGQSAFYFFILSVAMHSAVTSTRQEVRALWCIFSWKVGWEPLFVSPWNHPLLLCGSTMPPSLFFASCKSGLRTVVLVEST